MKNILALFPPILKKKSLRNVFFEKHARQIHIGEIYKNVFNKRHARLLTSTFFFKKRGGQSRFFQKHGGRVGFKKTSFDKKLAHPTNFFAKKKIFCKKKCSPPPFLKHMLVHFFCKKMWQASMFLTKKSGRLAIFLSNTFFFKRTRPPCF